MVTSTTWGQQPVAIPAGPRRLAGVLAVPAGATGVVVFAHGSGSGRHSPRNQAVAHALQEAGLATLLIDLLEEEEAADRRKVFATRLLAEPLHAAASWLRRQPATEDLRLGYFGASTGAAAALVAAARDPGGVGAIVCRGGRPDLAAPCLASVAAPTLLIVGGNDDAVLELNQRAFHLLRCPRELVVIPGATHLFPEPGALEEVSRLAGDWFVRHLTRATPGEQNTEYPPVAGPLFRDREDAARLLAQRIKGRDLHEPLVLAIPRGGLVTGAVLARELGAELDVVLARKLRAPGQPELAIGAVSEKGRVYLTDRGREVQALLGEYLAEEQHLQMAEIARRRRLFRAMRPQAAVAGRSVIVTDDGIATGATMIAALHVVRAQKPREVIVAVAVASSDRLGEVRRWCDDVICLHSPATFWAIGQFYADFTQVEDEEILRLLRPAGPAAQPVRRESTQEELNGR
jgi:predicted phosphoribosyltransferase/dienelactone hydrolase